MGKVMGKVTPQGEVADLLCRGINNEASLSGGADAKFSLPIPRRPLVAKVNSTNTERRLLALGGLAQASGVGLGGHLENP